MWEGNPHLFEHVSFMVLFFDPHGTTHTHQLNLSVQVGEVTE